MALIPRGAFGGGGGSFGGGWSSSDAEFNSSFFGGLQNASAPSALSEAQQNVGFIQAVQRKQALLQVSHTIKKTKLAVIKAKPPQLSVPKTQPISIQTSSVTSLVPTSIASVLTSSKTNWIFILAIVALFVLLIRRVRI